MDSIMHLVMTDDAIFDTLPALPEGDVMGHV